jgi:hypothetical protein
VEVLLRLEPEQRRYLRAGVAQAFEFTFKGEYLYMGARSRRGWLSPTIASSPLCRLRYTGDTELWQMEMYLFSRNGYDVDQDFPSGSGSPEECFAVAADFYLFEYDAFEAGSSRNDVPDGADGPEPKFQGEAMLLPPREAPDAAWQPDEIPAVEPAEPAEPASQEVPREPLQDPPEQAFREFLASIPRAATTGGLVLLADIDAFLGFVEGRTFDLAPRTCGFRRKELVEVNGLMAQPASLHKRPVLSDAPRVMCCFAVAEALGLLNVTRTLHQAVATDRIARYRALNERARWWIVLEAMWQRVPWSFLRPRAYGYADRFQAGRAWLGAELARRTEPLEFDVRLTLSAEVLEVFLFPFWRDAGLLKLTLDPVLRKRSFYEKRSTGLRRVEPTDLGRWTFERLSRIAPGIDHVDRMDDEDTGRYTGAEFLMRAPSAGEALVLDIRWYEDEEEENREDGEGDSDNECGSDGD